MSVEVKEYYIGNEEVSIKFRIEFSEDSDTILFYNYVNDLVEHIEMCNLNLQYYCKFVKRVQEAMEMDIFNQWCYDLCVGEFWFLDNGLSVERVC